MAVHPLIGVVQNYPWGSRTALAEIEGRTPSSRPEAELWLGTHPRGTATLVHPTAAASNLRDLVGGELPFLLKVLAADAPLSLQAHPSGQQAREGFLEEEARGVPIDALQRNYKDGSPKPELICALTPFFALSGFRSMEQALALTHEFGVFETIGQPSTFLKQGELEAYFRSLFSLQKKVLARSVEQIARCTQGDSLSDEGKRVAPWMSELAERYPADPGVIAALLLNLVELAPGEAIYLPAGNLHAYLRGVGLEVMASSDNVMRGGLTEKHVDVEELAKILHFEPYRPTLLRGELTSPEPGADLRVYRTPAREFELSVLTLENEASLTLEGPRLIYVLRGSISFESRESDQKIELNQGQAAYLPAEAWVSVTGPGQLACAGLPDASAKLD